MQRRWTSLLVATLMVVPAVPAAGASGEPPGRGGGSARASTPLAQPGRSVTLVTGDKVVLGSTAGGTGTSDTFTFVPAAGRPSRGYVSNRVDGRLRVVPRDVLPLVPGTLDPALFDIDVLLAEAGDDATDADIPVIWQRGTSTARARAPEAARDRRALPSIAAEAVQVPKSDAADLGAALVATRGDARALPQKIWLDRTVRGGIDANLPQVGAPQLWSAGGDGTGVTIAVLDSGVDATHPDLQGKVVASRNFSESPDGLDHFGHGTHVASIAAGSGAASGGERRGVAHAATILDAKVLGDDNLAPLSSVIAGVEWAGAQGADIANLSLGTDFTSDGTDPLSQAIDATTRDSGTLFVVAAGNRAAPRTIGTPAAASRALTVGAVAADDTLAPFSSGGPRDGGGIKPEITAPGVDIVAAWSTVDGAPGQPPYVPLSGTSMATPHVAGGAAVLAQRHPTWTPAQLKAALVSTAQEQPDAPVYAEGGGRLWLPDADAATLLPRTPAVDLGLLEYPQDGTTATREVAWVNTSAAPVTVDVRVQGDDLPSGTATVSPTSLRLAAGATGRATLTVRPGGLDSGPAPGVQGGEVVATVRGGGASGVPFAFEKEPERYDLRLRVLDSTGQPTTQALITVFSVDDLTTFHSTGVPLDGSGTATLRVPPGRYSADALIDTFDTTDGGVDGRWVVHPEFAVRAATERVLDARTARTASLAVAGTTTQQTYLQWQARREDARGNVVESGVGAFGPLHRLSATPTAPVTVGEFDTYLNGRASAPLLQFPGLAGPPPLPVLPSPSFVGDRRLRVVDVGAGTADDFAVADVRGALAVVTRRGHPPTASLAAADRAGAVLVVLANDTDRPWQTFLETDAQTPGVTVTSAVGAALGAAGRVRVRGTALADPTYDAVYPSPGRFPDDNRHVLTDAVVSRMARVTSGAAVLPGTSGQVLYGVGRAPVVPGFTVATGVVMGMQPGIRRTEYVMPGTWFGTGYRAAEETFASFHGSARREVAGSRRTETWFRAPWRPLVRQVTQSGSFPAAFRDRENVFLGLPPLADAYGHVENSLSFGGVNSVYTVERDGQLAGRSTGPFGFVPVAAGPADLQIRYDVGAGTLLPSQARSRTVWRLRSASPADGAVSLPLLEVALRLPVDLEGALTGRRALVRVTRPFGAAVRLSAVTVRVSTDRGTTWRPARTTLSGPAAASVRLPRVQDGAELAVRVRVVDGDGARVTQTLYQAAVG